MINFTGGETIKYTYSADGHKLRAVYTTVTPVTSKQVDYCGNLIFENGQLKQVLVDGGYIPMDDWSGTYRFYVKDHLGNNRMVVHQSGTIEQVNNYYPYGGLMSNSTGWNTQRFKYNGKEFDRMHGLDWYDFGARWMDASIGRWHSMDPLCEKYYNVSPYVYCLNNPVMYIDPDGRDCGDFYDEKGYLGNDGKADNNVYIMKTTETSFGEGNSQVPGAGLSKKVAKETKNFIKSNSGNTDAFMNNTIAYDNSIKIESSQSTRQSMVDQVSKDNGKGGTKDANNREYGGEITPEGITPCVGAVYSPKTSSSATIELNSTDYSTFHSHPSGSVVEFSNPSTSSISFSRNSTTYSFTQSPSPMDISNANSHIHYVFGRANSITYIYNCNGVQATFPTSKFVNLQK